MLMLEVNGRVIVLLMSYSAPLFCSGRALRITVWCTNVSMDRNRGNFLPPKQIPSTNFNLQMPTIQLINEFQCSSKICALPLPRLRVSGIFVFFCSLLHFLSRSYTGAQLRGSRPLPLFSKGQRCFCVELFFT